MGDDYHQRFAGVARLYGTEGLETFRRSHLAVIGIGGVGSWAAEALARSGIGELTLVDFDELCLTNTNRQIHALDGEIGRSKVDAMTERIARINPECKVHSEHRFFLEKSADELLDRNLDGVLDAIDSVRPKCLLLSECRKRGIPIVTCGAAGGRRDATAIQIADLSRTFNDLLLQKVRRDLRSEYGFPRGDKPKKFHIPAVFSSENAVFPQADGSVCTQRPEDITPGIRCDAGYGTATHITATFGLFAAGELLRKLAAAT